MCHHSAFALYLLVHHQELLNQTQLFIILQLLFKRSRPIVVSILFQFRDPNAKFSFLSFSLQAQLLILCSRSCLFKASLRQLIWRLQVSLKRQSCS